MTRWRAPALMLAGGLLLALPATVSARCSGSGPTFRCDPIISESLRRQSLDLPKRYTPRKSYEYRGNTYRAPSTGAMIHRYRYKSPAGRTYKGKIQSLPGGSYRHKGSWK